MSLYFAVGLLIVGAMLGWLNQVCPSNRYIDAIHVFFPLIVIAVCFRLLLKGYPYYAAGLFVFYGIIFSISIVLRAKRQKEHNRSWK